MSLPASGRQRCRNRPSSGSERSSTGELVRRHHQPRRNKRRACRRRTPRPRRGRRRARRPEGQGGRSLAVGIALDDPGRLATNRHYLERGQLHVERFSHGFAWLDTGTPESLLQAADLIETIEARVGLKIAYVED
jgi:hypothetical protein